MTDGTGADPVRGWTVVNPLPAMLAHYERELLETLGAAGCRVFIEPAVSVEMTGLRATARLSRTAQLLASRVERHGPDPTLVTWPAFGAWDGLTWLPRRGQVHVVFHDPEPLRRQIGIGRRSYRSVRKVYGSKIRAVAHTQIAAAALAKRGIAALVVPHPVLAPADQVEASRAGIAVLGQWKPARSILALERIAASTARDRPLTIGGRGWPSVPRWEVTDAFLSETEIAGRIAAAACVVLPYDQYFQSNVAVRCLESLTPVVGVRHEFVEGLFGADWPGLVEHADDWAAATERAAGVDSARMAVLRESYWQLCVSRWCEFADEARDARR